METLPSYVLAKISSYFPWEDRLVRLRLIDNRFHHAVSFADVENLKFSELEKLSNSQRDQLKIFGRDSDSKQQYFNDPITKQWFSAVIDNFPIFGEFLQNVSFDSKHNDRDRGWFIDAATFSKFVRSCPNVRRIDFVKSVLHPDAYEHFLAWVPKLERLSMNPVSDAERLAPILRSMHLTKLELNGANVAGLNTADNSSIRWLRLDDETVLNGADALADLVRFPNLIVHKSGRSVWSGFDKPTLLDDDEDEEQSPYQAFNLYRPDAPNVATDLLIAYANLNQLRRSDPISYAVRPRENFKQQIRIISHFVPNLRQLNLDYRGRLVFDPIHQLLTNLETVIIQGYGNNFFGEFPISKSDWAAIVSLLNLKTLRITTIAAKLNGPDQDWPNRVHCVNLRELTTTFLNIIPKELLRAILNKCPKLRILKIDGYQNINTDSGSQIIDYACRLGSECQLRRLNLAQVTKTELGEFFELPLRYLRHLWIRFDIKHRGFFKRCDCRECRPEDESSDESDSSDDVPHQLLTSTNEKWPVVAKLRSIELDVVDLDDDSTRNAVVKIVKAGQNLKELVLCGPSFSDDNGETLFEQLGRHRSLEKVEISLREWYDYREAAPVGEEKLRLDERSKKLIQLLLDGRRASIDHGYALQHLDIKLYPWCISGIDQETKTALLAVNVDLRMEDDEEKENDGENDVESSVDESKDAMEVDEGENEDVDEMEKDGDAGEGD